MRERLIFGTARLNGGPYAADAAALIGLCLDHGITRFDTAPAYGMGAAEELLGRLLEGRAVQIATKVGGPRPAWPALRGHARRWLRQLAPAPHRGATGLPPPYLGPARRFRFDPASVRRSVARSLTALRRETIDTLLLHEAHPADVPAATAVLGTLRDRGTARAIGFAPGGTAAGGTALPGWLTQAAPRARDFLAGGSTGAADIFHTVLGAAEAAAAADADVRRALGRLGTAIGGTADASRRLAAAALALHRAHPAAGIIVGTTSPERLAAFLRLVDRIEAQTMGAP